MNTQLNLDKSEWKAVKLGEIATEESIRVENPAKLGFDKFVGLEHFISGDLIIKSYKSTKDLTSSTKKFQKGDILLARRNAYLQRASLVDFEGVCSGDAFVLRENSNKIMGGFLAFIVNSQKLWDFANSNAAGTMSKRVKWRDLANYEFLLPPKDQQAEIAKLLWAIDDVIQKDFSLLNAAETHLNVTVEKLLHGLSLTGKTIVEILSEVSTKTELISLDKCGEIFKGSGIPKAHLVESGVPCVRYGELYTRHHSVIRSFGSFIDHEMKKHAFKLRKNDVLFAGSGESISEIGKSAVFISDQETYAGSDILIFRPNKMDGVFLGYLMNSQIVRHQLNKYGTGATVMHIYKSDLEKIKIPVIAYDEQVQIGKKFEKLYYNMSSIKKKINSSYELQKSLINEFF